MEFLSLGVTKKAQETGLFLLLIIQGSACGYKNLSVMSRFSMYNRKKTGPSKKKN
mgnify:CR=1 FL=1